MNDKSPLRTIEWVGGLDDGYASLIDQTLLPTELRRLACRDVETMWDAIKQLRVRGAPAIGIAAAMGVVLGIRDVSGDDKQELLQRLDLVGEYLKSSRPTGINLAWAVDRMTTVARSCPGETVLDIKNALLDEAKIIRDQDAASCRAIGRHGESLIKTGCSVLTHCNAGGLATAEFGTALAPLYTAHKMGRSFRVYAGETRPLMQGSRLTAWELQQAGIDVTVLCDSMAGALMNEGGIDLVITGADRIAANGDVANKIGTYSLASLASAHDIPFYVAAPSSTFDLSIADGSAIPIEHRDPDEIRQVEGRAVAPPNVDCYSPAFDVTPARLIRGIITERGVIQPVNQQEITEILG